MQKSKRSRRPALNVADLAIHLGMAARLTAPQIRKLSRRRRLNEEVRGLITRVRELVK